MKDKFWKHLKKQNTIINIFSIVYFIALTQCHEVLEPAVRVVRFRIDYPNAHVEQISKYNNWQNIMQKSVLASLRFVNKHWLICGSAEHDISEKVANDCGKLQVTGEEITNSHYRINATFITNSNPIKNAKVDATSTVFGVVQIGLRGGIFQYTNAMKLLGKPLPDFDYEEKFFCYSGYELYDTDKCLKHHAHR